MIKKLCVDDYGNEWYTCQAGQMHTQRFPSYVWGGKSIQESDWFPVCIMETYIHWGLLSKDEAESVGFILRWQ